MLQQVLESMYVEPELLAGLQEKEKQTLFCLMREEQVKRWQIWDQQQMDITKTSQPRCNRKGKSVQFHVDNYGEPLVQVIEDKFCDQIDSLESAEEKGSEEPAEKCYKETRLANIQVELHRTDSSETAKKIPKYIDVAAKINSSPSPAVVNFNERGALQELSLNKVVKVASKVAEWEKRVREKDSKPVLNRSPSKVTIRTENAIAEENKEAEIQEKQWREQQKKANETEIRIRTIARLAREEHRRSYLENNENYDLLKNTLVTSDDMCQKLIKTSNNENIANWYRTCEIPKKAGFESNGAISTWFYGFMSKKMSEDILSQNPNGSFLVRISERICGYAISLKSSAGFKHYLIDVTGDQYRLNGANKMSHLTLGELVKYYSINPLSESDDVLKQPCARNIDESETLKKSLKGEE